MQQAAVQERGKQILDQALAEQDGGRVISMDERRAGLDPGVMRDMATEQHGAAAILFAEIVQVTEALYLSKEIRMRSSSKNLISETSSMPDSRSP